jgi:hypothetical protein
MKEALSSSETWVITRATRHNIPEDAILHLENMFLYFKIVFPHINLLNVGCSRPAEETTRTFHQKNVGVMTTRA